MTESVGKPPENVERLSPAAYEALVDAAETYRAALVVRLAGEAGLRTGEITRVRPSDIREVGENGHALLTVYDDADEAVRTAYLPPSLAAELRRYADSMGLADDDRFVDVSTRRVQMIVADTAERAAARSTAVTEETVTPRTLRQFFARSLLVERDIDPRVVRAIGGWETLGALDPYLEHPEDPEILDAFGQGEITSQEQAEPATGVVIDALDAVATAPSRDELLAAIPERFASASRWEAAWVATRERTADEVAIATAAGIDADELAKRGLRTIDDDAPWMQAIDSAEPVFRAVDDLANADRGSGDLTSGDLTPEERTGEAVAAESKGATRNGAATDTAERNDAATDTAERNSVGSDVSHGTIAAIPLSYQNTSYGVLCLLGSASNRRPRGPGQGQPKGADDVPTDTHRRALAKFGGVVGRSLASFRWYDLLHSDAVLELEFETSSTAAFLVRLTTELGCDVEIDSIVGTDDALLTYVDVDGATPHDVADSISDIEGIEDTRVVETRDDGCTLGFVVSGSSPAYTLTEQGATIRTASASNGKLRIVADVPTGTDVRPLAEALRRSFSDVRLVGKQALDREPDTGTSFSDDVEAQLTDRQRATLKAAYHGGYFDWPRGITAEEVADAMDVSSPTLHNHLRKGQRALLDALFDDQS